MYISKIKLHNFRSFGGNHTVEFQPGVNYLVGNNNSGKTTIFRAVDFLCNGGTRDDVIAKDCLEDNNEFVAVEVELSGDSMREVFVADKNLKKYAGCVVKENGLETIRLKRSSLEVEITQAGKKKNCKY